MRNLERAKATEDAPRLVDLEPYGASMLFLMEECNGNTVACFATAAAIAAIQGRLQGDMASLFEARRLVFEQIAATIYAERGEPTVLIDESSVAHLTAVLWPST
jgi:hypothetical protein